jgi:hypothetical protein
MTLTDKELDAPLIEIMMQIKKQKAKNEKYTRLIALIILASILLNIVYLWI